MSKTERPITKEEAIEILSSGLRYCQKAGINILAESGAGGLVLTLPGVIVDIESGRAVFRVCGYSPDSIPGGDVTTQAGGDVISSGCDVTSPIGDILPVTGNLLPIGNILPATTGTMVPVYPATETLRPIGLISLPPGGR